MVNGDIDGDGIFDIVTANRNNNGISVLLGNGDGTFLPKTDIAVGSAPSSIVMGDLDKDNDQDIVLSGFGYGFGAGAIKVLLNKGDGTFDPATDYTVGLDLQGVALADLNGDNNLDIITANTSNDSVAVLLGKGSGSFEPKTDYAVGSGPKEVAIGDLNEDGASDIVTANRYSNSVSVLLGKGDGRTFSKTDYAVGSGPEGLAIGDLDGDGNFDIITANRYSDSVSVLLGKGDGTIASKTDITVEEEPEGLAVADLDLDLDDDLDLILSGFGYSFDRVLVLLNEGKGTFTNKDVAVGTEARGIAIGNLDFDGDLDLVTANIYDDSVSVRLNNSIPDGGVGTGERVFTYDPIFNQLESETDELGRQTLYQIDTLTGNTLSMTRVVGEVGGLDDVVTQYTYTDKTKLTRKLTPWDG